MDQHQSRREFLRRALIAGTAVPFGARALRAETRPRLDNEGKRSATERIQIGAIGVHGRGFNNLEAVAHEEIVALADVDLNRLTETKRHLADRGRVPSDVPTYQDFRELLERKDLDAVVISTPDHVHAIPAVQAMRRKLHVYCEKPLAHSVHEIRLMRETARENRCITQMGTQIHAGDNYRRAVEIVRSGVLGKVARVYVWMGGRPHTDGVRVEEGQAPAHVDYDLWLGPAPYRPFHPSHFHFKWRYWFDFGGGVLADFGCHYMDLPHWALGLSHVSRVRAEGVKDFDGQNDVPGKMRVEYHYPARKALPPVHLTWYHGGWMPEGAEVYAKHSAVLFEGENGRLLADYDTHKLFLDQPAGALPEVERIPSSIGHHREWLEAIRAGGKTTCHFEYSGALAETVLLGNVSYRAGNVEIEWDDERLEARNSKDAAKYVRREYRDGWAL